MNNIICSGFGGQGILTAGLILARTGMENGLNVTWIPSYGSEMRGGTANCAVRISNGKIGSPFVKAIDILLAMSQPALAKFEQSVIAGGWVVANTSMIKDWTFRKDIGVIQVDASAAADELRNAKGANVVMLGALAASEALFTPAQLDAGIRNFFADKGKVNPLNDDCFKKGMTCASVEGRHGH